ncbi:uncharacterized protein LOC142347725 [Convolutriloba macropyga]|uniref:uncharacterized protein LOC142347725 n=1 Tax=Convolutriloba macropyga TaxID=536237 RepID=UPI003F527FD4
MNEIPFSLQFSQTDQSSDDPNFMPGICYVAPFGCNHWNYTTANNIYNQTDLNWARVGNYVKVTKRLLKGLGYISIVCCLITIVTYFLWRPLKCYARKLVMVYAFVSLYFDAIILYVAEKDLVSESCRFSEQQCLFTGLLINFGYSSLCAWTVVIFIQIYRMAKDVDAFEPTWKYQLVTHVIVWGTAAIQAIVPYSNKIIGYIGRPVNGCGYCFWDNDSVEVIGHSFSSNISCSSSVNVGHQPLGDNKWQDDHRSSRVWLWMAGAFYALLCMAILAAVFVAIKIVLRMRASDANEVRSTGAGSREDLDTQGGFLDLDDQELVVLSEIHRKKLSAITVMHIIVTMSIVARTIWSMNAGFVYNNGKSPHCKLTVDEVLCVPTQCVGSLENVSVIYNRDTSIFMIFEACVSLFAGIMNFLLFCVFSRTFATCGRLWVVNLFTKGQLILPDDALEEHYSYDVDEPFDEQLSSSFDDGSVINDRKKKQSPQIQKR